MIDVDGAPECEFDGNATSMGMTEQKEFGIGNLELGMNICFNPIGIVIIRP
jgi:hypothetical protein